MYLFYIDESGNRDFSHLEKERFYILTAVGMYENHWKRFHFDITRFKQSIIDRIMRDEGVKLDVSTDAEVKSTYLRNPKNGTNTPSPSIRRMTSDSQSQPCFMNNSNCARRSSSLPSSTSSPFCPTHTSRIKKQSISKHGNCFASALSFT